MREFFLKRRVKKLKTVKGSELIWLLEHPTTFTSGIRFDKKDILNNKIKIFQTDRGGKITLHNPGQKIVYLVLNLNKRQKDIRKLINIIEKSIIEFLNFFGIKSYADKKNIGIWVKEKKIAAIGIKVTKWIAYHGCSINIDNNLEQYLNINPCGLENSKITSIYNEKKKKIKGVNKKLIEVFMKNINNF